MALCVQAGRALLESKRTKAAHRFIYRGLAIDPANADLLALQTALAGAELEDTDDPSKMAFGELMRRVARGAATEEMQRIWRRRAEARGIDPDAPGQAPGLGPTGDPFERGQPRKP